LKFEKAALLRDQIKELKRMMDGGAPAKDVKAQPRKLSEENATKPCLNAIISVRIQTTVRLKTAPKFWLAGCCI
jgi:hypothetical protein